MNAVKTRFLMLILVMLTGHTQAVAQAQRVTAVTSFSILEDLVSNVGQDRIGLTNLVPRNGDAHTYQPSIADANAINKASLIFVNGLGLESWGRKLFGQLPSGKVIILSSTSGIQQLTHNGEPDPHVWWNLMNAITYVKGIAQALSQVDPANKTFYENNALRYSRTLADLDLWAKSTLAALPKKRRVIVTNHDALRYLANRYGLEIVGTVFPSGSTESSPSAKELVRLVGLIREHEVKAIFAENTLNARLVQTIARETGARLAPALYTDALGKQPSEGDSFVKAFRHNILTIRDALR